MRSYDEPICVLFSDRPQQFIWRNRLLLVKEVQGRWSRSTAWWESPRVSAARGDAATTGAAVDTGRPPAADLLEEMEVWRVEAGNGMQRGVYELARSVGRDDWVLQAVCD
ncbi:DUF6504 family protein [Tessaracoccus antarcticus]|uniref:DUF6504 domain-containing protein n=1 Tax=Tessaracoccus antarcticus TaxID=2479848 RepID=A0A3M0G527_9ACTN|nr:DUF6504 family protein [Tessaracoccus antarcticus]RMB59678.1 hypothetical protein EAX62_07910 [Tessaracoccus antarcticus]